MSGHSKWAKIKRSKGAADKKKGKVFTRCIHEIAIAVKEGKSGDPDSNPRLRLAVDKARASNMPGDNIDRAIKRALGGEGTADRAEVTYEGYGPSGTAVMVEVLTDNKNRTVGEIRHAFTRCGGALGENGCVGWMFAKKGYISINIGEASEDKVFEVALDAGAGDVQGDEDMWEITCEPQDFIAVKQALEKHFTLEEAEIQFVPNSYIDVAGKEAEQMVRLVETLEDMDDVMNVATNCNFTEVE